MLRTISHHFCDIRSAYSSARYSLNISSFRPQDVIPVHSSLGLKRLSRESFEQFVSKITLAHV
jgi:hypothetical protein